MATASTASPMDVDTNTNHSIVDTKKHHHHHHHHKDKLAKDSKVEVTRKSSEDEKLEKRKKDHGESKYEPEAKRRRRSNSRDNDRNKGIDRKKSRDRSRDRKDRDRRDRHKGGEESRDKERRRDRSRSREKDRSKDCKDATPLEKQSVLEMHVSPVKVSEKQEEKPPTSASACTTAETNAPPAAPANTQPFPDVDEVTRKRLIRLQRQREILAKYSAQEKEKNAALLLSPVSPSSPPPAIETPALEPEGVQLEKDEKEESIPGESPTSVAQAQALALAEAEHEREGKLLEILQHEQANKPPVSIICSPPPVSTLSRKPSKSFDMFSDSPIQEEDCIEAVPLPPRPTTEAADGFDDAEGYYRYKVGEMLGTQYEITEIQGKGVFSSVVKARDIQNGEVVAIKIIRHNDTMRSAGVKEINLLKKLKEKDPEGRRHCIRMLSHFEAKSHLCIVFESMEMNLRDLLKKFGKNIGLNIQAVRIYAQQLFLGLKHLHSLGMCHADIKLDNIVVNDKKTCVKICDFGSATEVTGEVTTYLVSRFYRPPEIILGYPFDLNLDVWSMGCCIAELFTGQILFPGRTNNEMLRLFLELRGHFPKKMLRKCRLRSKHFDDNFNFLRQDQDPLTGSVVTRVVPEPQKPTRDILNLLMPNKAARHTEAEYRKIVQLRDLLDRCLQLDPGKRITAQQALAHPFVSEV